MIDIRIDNESLDLFASTSLTLNMVNPLFSKEVDYNSHSFSFNIPNSPQNRRVLQSPEITLRSRTTTQSISLFIAGVRWIDGLLRVKSATQTQYTVYLQLDNSAFAEAWKNKTLSSYTLGGVRNIGIHTALRDHAKDTSNGSVLTYDYVFAPIANLNFYDGQELSDFRNRINYYDHDSAVQNFPDNLAYANETSIYEYTLTPFIYLTALLGYLFSEIDYDLQGGADWLTDTEIQTLVLYNNFGLDKPSTFPTAGGTTRTWNEWLDDINLQQHVPIMGLGEFMQSVLDIFCLSIIIDEKSKTARLISRKSILADQQAIDWTEKSLEEPNNSDEQIGGYYFHYQLDTDDAVTDQIRSVEGFRINTEVLHFENLPGTGDELGDLRYVQTETAYYQYFLVEDSNPAEYGWQFFAYYMPEKIVGDGSIEVNPSIGTVNMARRGIPSTFAFDWQRLPYVNQIGSTELYGIGTQEYLPRLMFFRGYQDTAASTDTYPLLSSDDLTAKGASVGNYSLFWEGTKGVYEVWWKAWAEAMMASRVFTQPMLLHIGDLLTLDYAKKVRVRTETGEANCLIKTLQITINMERIEPVQAELVNLALPLS